MIPLQQPEVMATVAGQIVQYGVLGICVLAFAYVIVKLWGKNNEIQQARVDDAKANAVAFAGLVEKATVAITAQTAATEAQTEAVRDLREALRRGGSS